MGIINYTSLGGVQSLYVGCQFLLYVVTALMPVTIIIIIIIIILLLLVFECMYPPYDDKKYNIRTICLMTEPRLFFYYPCREYTGIK